MLTQTLSAIAAGFGLGVALAGAPGPVQAVLLSETIRGGVGRGLRAQAGANITFAALVLALGLGLSFVAPSGLVLRAIKIVGGLFLVWLGVDGFHSAGERVAVTEERRGLAPYGRGALAVVLNPGVWIFLGTAAFSLISTAAHSGGTGSAVLAALALAVGVALGDSLVVLLGGLGLRRVNDAVVVWVHRVLSTVIIAVGVWLIVSGVLGM